ncbi:hypothetical protein [Actinomadura rupiterrae]|nr:hypothetical protein [Actinomadura rupiterrae]MCP2336966.1 hypothetical protein [Actinomadura rupiterrae]
MLPQSRRIWPYLALIAVLAFAIKNPVGAAHGVNHVAHSALAFMGALG